MSSIVTLHCIFILWVKTKLQNVSGEWGQQSPNLGMHTNVTIKKNNNLLQLSVNIQNQLLFAPCFLPTHVWLTFRRLLPIHGPAWCMGLNLHICQSVPATAKQILQPTDLRRKVLKWIQFFWVACSIWEKVSGSLGLKLHISRDFTQMK